MAAVSRQVNLVELFHNFPLKVITPVPDGIISGIVSDSRMVKPGDLFVALVGDTADGHRFISDAIQRGAAGVVGMKPLTHLPVPYVQVEDSRRALAHLAAAYYGHPSRQLTVIGITGTDGKTTTANLIYHILASAGVRAGMISTVNAVIGDRVLDTGFHVTTPDAPDVQQYLAEMVEAGLTHVVLEATSHGLAQYRLEACDFDIGVVTNITHEHLDFHQTFEAYRAAKARLFTSLSHPYLKPGKTPRAAILNREDDSFSYLSGLTQVPRVSYGLKDADVIARDIFTHPGGIRFLARGKGFVIRVTSRLLGAFNVLNCLAAIAVTVPVLGLDIEAVQQGVATFDGVPGRMESIDLGQEFTAMVDFAHTPNALRNSLQAARGLCQGRVIAVFGSAGLRDRTKRRMMAETALELADLTVLTAEDPRTESLDAILAEMAEGAHSRGGMEGLNFWRIPDRGEAISFAVSLAKPGDMVIACGKGHEQSMCFGTVEYLG